MKPYLLVSLILVTAIAMFIAGIALTAVAAALHAT